MGRFGRPQPIPKRRYEEKLIHECHAVLQVEGHMMTTFKNNKRMEKDGIQQTRSTSAGGGDGPNCIPYAGMYAVHINNTGILSFLQMPRHSSTFWNPHSSQGFCRSGVRSSWALCRLIEKNMLGEPSGGRHTRWHQICCRAGFSCSVGLTMSHLLRNPRLAR